jgi:hypothetical protein
MASETLNHKEFGKSETVLAMAIHAMDIFLTSQIARHNGEITVEFLDELEFDALDRAQTIISFSR